MSEPARAQLDYNCLVPGKRPEFRWMVIDFSHIKQKIQDKLDHKNLNEVLPFNTTAENMAKWICGQVPGCFKVMVQESENNIAWYEKDK